MTSLPTEVPERLQSNPCAVSAYNICLTVEKTLQLAIHNDNEVGNTLVFIRILGYLLHYVPTQNGLDTLVSEIVSANECGHLFELGRTYYDHYLRALRSNRGKMETPYLSPMNRPSFDTVANLVDDTLKNDSQSYAIAKRRALVRDGHRCIITGRYGTSSVKEIKELEKRMTADYSLRVDRTRCAHIIPQSTHVEDEPESEERLFATTIWDIMERFGYPQIREELNGSNIYRLENMMTTTLSFQMEFDLLSMWLIATGVKDKYKLEAVDPIDLRGYPEFVTFTTDDPVNVPVPSPVYLAIHAACAKVAHLSGATDCMEKYDGELEESTTLDPNGTSGGVLEHAIGKHEV